MKYSDYPKAEAIHEMDYDGPGCVMGVHLEGHLSFDEVEVYIAGDPDEHFQSYRGGVGDLDVSHTYVASVPTEDEEGEPSDEFYIFVYSDEPQHGYRPVTRIERGDPAKHFCAFHPDERADLGFPGEQFASSTVSYVLAEHSYYPQYRGRFVSSHVYLCPPCSKKFGARRLEAYDQAMVEYKFEAGKVD